MAQSLSRAKLVLAIVALTFAAFADSSEAPDDVLVANYGDDDIAPDLMFAATEAAAPLRMQGKQFNQAQAASAEESQSLITELIEHPVKGNVQLTMPLGKAMELEKSIQADASQSKRFDSQEIVPEKDQSVDKVPLDRPDPGSAPTSSKGGTGAAMLQTDAKFSTPQELRLLGLQDALRVHHRRRRRHSRHRHTGIIWHHRRWLKSSNRRRRTSRFIINVKHPERLWKHRHAVLRKFKRANRQRRRELHAKRLRSAGHPRRPGHKTRRL